MIKKFLFLFIAALMLLSGINGFTQETDSEIQRQIRNHLNALDSRDWEDHIKELVQIGQPAVKPLIDLLNQNTGYPSARACQALAEIGTPEAIQSLMAVLRNERYQYQVKNYAVSALGKVPSEEVISLLIDVLQNDDQWGIRLRAAVTLEEIGSPRTADALIAASRDENEHIRGFALQALTRIAPEKAGSVLIKALSDESWETWSRAYQSLVDMGDPAVDPLIEALTSESAHVRRVSVRALGRIKTDRAVAPLIEMLKEEDWMIRNDASVALVRINSVKAVDPLNALIKSPDTRAAEEAAWILGEMNSCKAVQTYKHPSLNIEFQAPAGWKQISWPGDPSVYEIADSVENLHVVIWYTETMQDGPGYLEKMADMKGMQWQGKPIHYKADGRSAWMLDAFGHIKKKPVRLLLSVIHFEKPRKHADHNALYLIEIRCHKSDFPRQRQYMQNILDSIRFIEPAD
jgi:HEAT repeat protein